MDLYGETIIIDTNNKKKIDEEIDLYKSRNIVYNELSNENEPLVSIYIYAYNNIEKTRICLQSIIEYTKNINYELILIDNGSNDGTYELYKDIVFDKKIIIKVTKNIGLLGPAEMIYRVYRGKYLVSLGNDVYVTEGWLENILKCFESDPKVGFVVPMSCNVSNYQDAGLRFETFSEMQELARRFNKSDKSKWQERLRLVTPLAVYKREVLDVVGKFDCAFLHDFGEDDFSLRVRRAGYKLILCGDTFVCHDHKMGTSTSRTSKEIEQSLNIGRKKYLKKYNGLDAWDDINNYEIDLINMINEKPNTKCVDLLGIDVRCGTPVLEIKNRLKKFNIYESRLNFFSTNVKYYPDLISLSNETFIDRITYLKECFINRKFDYIILGEPINLYEKPIEILNDMINLLKRHGVLLFKLQNVSDIFSLLTSLGYEENANKQLPIYIISSDIYKCLKLMNVSKIQVKNNLYNFDKNSEELIENIVSKNIEINMQKVSKQLKTKEYLFCVTK